MFSTQTFFHKIQKRFSLFSGDTIGLMVSPRVWKSAVLQITDAYSFNRQGCGSVGLGGGSMDYWESHTWELLTFFRIESKYSHCGLFRIESSIKYERGEKLNYVLDFDSPFGMNNVSLAIMLYSVTHFQASGMVGLLHTRPTCRSSDRENPRTVPRELTCCWQKILVFWREKTLINML